MVDLKQVVLHTDMAAAREMLLSLVYQRDICETKREMLLPHTALTVSSWQCCPNFLCHVLGFNHPVFLSCSWDHSPKYNVSTFCLRHYIQE